MFTVPENGGAGNALLLKEHKAEAIVKGAKKLRKHWRDQFKFSGALFERQNAESSRLPDVSGGDDDEV